MSLTATSKATFINTAEGTSSRTVAGRELSRKFMRLSRFMLAVTLLAACKHAPVSEPTMTLNLESPLSQWVGYALSQSDAGFVPLEPVTALVTEPLVASKAGMGFFLKRIADPHRLPNVRFDVHAAGRGGIDLLRARYESAGLSLLLLEGSNFLLVRASRLNARLADAKNKEAYVRDLLEQAVNTDTEEHHWKFSFPADFERTWQPQLLSSVPTVPLRDLMSRHDRADILIQQGEVHFLFYKKIEQLEDFLPGDAWFSAKARADIQALAALGGTPKAP